MFSFDRLLNSFLLKLRELTFRKLHTAQKMKFSIKDFFSKCDQIRSKLGIWSHLLKRSLIENFFFCAVSLKCVNPLCNIFYT